MVIFFFFFFSFFCLSPFHALFITSSLGEDSWSLGQCGGVFLSCTDKLNRRTLLVRPISKQDPFSNFSGFFPSVRILFVFFVFVFVFLNRTSTNKCQSGWVKKWDKVFLKKSQFHLNTFCTRYIYCVCWLRKLCFIPLSFSNKF